MKGKQETLFRVRTLLPFICLAQLCNANGPHPALVVERLFYSVVHSVLLQQTAAVVDFLLALLQTILSMLVNASQCYSQLHSQLYSQLALIAVRKIKFPEPSFIISIYLKSDFKSSAISSTGLESAASDLWLFRRLGLFVPGSRVDTLIATYGDL